jgi:hypothetical protein
MTIQILAMMGSIAPKLIIVLQEYVLELQEIVVMELLAQMTAAMSWQIHVTG